MLFGQAGNKTGDQTDQQPTATAGTTSRTDPISSVTHGPRVFDPAKDIARA